MNDQIYIHRYTLKSGGGLNSRSHALTHEGVLIRIDKNGDSGYACLHPWEELGDLSLDTLLKQLSEGRGSRQLNCAIDCADVDRKARQDGVSLFDSLNLPLSHATIVGGLDKIESAVDAGFDTVKLKMGKDVESNILFLNNINKEFPSLSIRIDFNGVSGFGALDKMLGEVGKEVHDKIDFIEDPFPRGDDRWMVLRDKYGVQIGIDRGIEKAEGKFDIAVVKPAINDTVKICEAAQLAGRSVVITSYMDHPVGQRYAAFCAAKLNSQYLGLVNSRCGLVTHGLYESDEFIERAGRVAPELFVEPCSTGLGFDDLLEKVNWKKLL